MADTKEAKGVKEALVARMGDLPSDAAGYRQAILLCISASESEDGSESAAAFSEASEVALDAVRLMGERYSASLTAPCMAVYSLCILAPLVIMTIIPVMGIGGLFGSMAIDEGILTVVMLVLIPAVMVFICLWLRSANPFLDDGRGRMDPRVLLPLASMLPVFVVMILSDRSAEESLMVSSAVSALATLILTYSERRAESERIKAEKGLRDSVFEMGTAMLSGSIFENASVESMKTRPECMEASASLRRELDISRGDVEAAVRRALSPLSGEVSRILCDVHRCSMTDWEEAGRLASSVGRQFQNRADVMTGLELKLKSMTDMMTGTAMIFAPMVLGLSISLLGPLGDISGFQRMEGTGLVTAAYLIELCAMVSVMSSCLGTDRSLAGIVWRYSLMLPISLIVFVLCSSISLRRVFTETHPFQEHGIQEEDPRRGRNGIRRDAVGDPPLPLHLPVGILPVRWRNAGNDRRLVEGARDRRDPLRRRRCVLPSGAGEELRPERIPAAGVHEGHGDRRGRIPGLRSLRPVRTRLVSPFLCLGRCDYDGGHGRRMGV